MDETPNSSNSMSLLNEGFLLDSANLSLSVLNDQSKNDSNQLQDSEATVFDDTENREMEVDVNQNDDIEDDSEVAELELEEDSGAAVEGEEANQENVEVGQKKKSRQPSGEEEVDEEEEEGDENEPEYPLPQFPLSRVKKIMAICMGTEDEDEPPLPNKNDKNAGSKGKGNIIINKDAVYLVTLATEYFVSLIGERAGNVTVTNKKKTMTFEHLRQALSDTDAFAFLEGCFQPSVIRGD